MKIICPECKNELNLENHPNLKENDVIECEFCGITLKVVNLDTDEVETEIMDEGK